MNKNISNAERIADSSLPGYARMVKPDIILMMPQDPVHYHRLRKAQKFLGSRIKVHDGDIQ